MILKFDCFSQSVNSCEVRMLFFRVNLPETPSPVTPSNALIDALTRFLNSAIKGSRSSTIVSSSLVDILLEFQNVFRQNGGPLNLREDFSKTEVRKLVKASPQVNPDPLNTIPVSNWRLEANDLGIKI